MGLLAKLRRDWMFLTRLRRLYARISPISLDSEVLVCDDFEEAVDRFGENRAISDERRSYTYRELDSLANRFAHWAQSRRLHRGDTVALVMLNRAEYLAVWLGLSKVGVATALINTNLTGQALAHCLSISGASQIICDEDCWPAIEEARDRVNRNLMLWVMGLKLDQETDRRRNLDKPLQSGSSVRPNRSAREGLTNRDTALYIYTSGTTGMPKAARVPHSRVRTYMRAFAGCTGATEKDITFNVLPLYHSTGGLVGVGPALLNGGALVVRRKFSASGFWADVSQSRATLFVYIGELCRYLVNTPPQPDERSHKLRLAYGNGLRGDVWGEFQSRFAIPDIIEFYGSTEGNVSVFNFDGKPGAIGRVPGWVKNRINFRLIRYDLEADAPERGVNGLAIPAGINQVGEAIGLIADDNRHDFSGYADKAASEKKIMRDVFVRGDKWFRTGDLMKMDREGYVYFIDRIGDTFRWKGENVSTAEVEQRLAGGPGVQEVVAYGVAVPHHDGKAGMVGLVLDGRFQATAFAQWVEKELPSYAQPQFVRILKQADTTGTFKYRKSDLVADGFDPNLAGQVYVRGGKAGYTKVTPKLMAQIESGDYRF
jgi:Acyl-CoA synthetases (AMP-forming)/AMP-acid ligases II